MTPSEIMKLFVANHIVISKNDSSVYLTKFSFDGKSDRYVLLRENNQYLLVSLNNDECAIVTDFNQMINEDQFLLDQVIDNIPMYMGKFRLIVDDPESTTVRFNVLYHDFSLETQYNPVFGFSKVYLNSYRMVDLLGDIFYSKNYLIQDLLFQYKLKEKDLFIEYVSFVQSECIKIS